MVQLVGITNRVAYGASSTSAAGLQGQLARFEKELADCVNCASAKTTEGKQKIEAISLRISQIRERIEQASQLRSCLQANGPASVPSAGLGRLIDVKA
jgi:hypothetical protein